MKNASPPTNSRSAHPPLRKRISRGVLDEGVLQRTGQGTPQGGVISPLLANLYLQHVLDAWFEREAKPRVPAVPAKRFERYGLRHRPDKTRYLDIRPRRLRERGKGATFDFPGFTHY